MREVKIRKELENQRRLLYDYLFQTCGSMTVNGVEALARKIHNLTIKIHSFKGGLYGNKD